MTIMLRGGINVLGGQGMIPEPPVGNFGLLD
jgi:hypothetical protein